MKTSIRFLVAVAALLAPVLAQAEIQGIDPATECPALVANEYSMMLLKLKTGKEFTAENFPKNFQAEKNRFVFCLDNVDTSQIKNSLTLANTSQYPVIIYGLTVKGSEKDANGSYLVQTGQPILTVSGGRVLLQNLKAENLRGPVVLTGGNVNLHTADISCYLDKAMNQMDFYPKTAVKIGSTKSEFSNIKVGNCNEAIEVLGGANTLKGVAVSFDKTKSPFDMNGGKGIVMSDSTLTAYAPPSGAEESAASIFNSITGYDDALILMNRAVASYVTANGPVEMKFTAPQPETITTESYTDRAGNLIPASTQTVTPTVNPETDYPRLSAGTINGTIYVSGPAVIKENTLSGNPAVMIMKGVSPVIVSKNNYKTDTTVVYADSVEHSTHALFDVAWMAKHVPDGQDYADEIIGKLMDQGNTSTQVEFYVMDTPKDSINQINVEKNELQFKHQCPVMVAEKDIKFVLTKSGAKEERVIKKDEKFFQCKGVSEAEPLKVGLDYFVRTLTNTPSVSAMSTSVVVADLSDKDETILAAQPVTVPVGSELADTGLGGGGNAANIPSNVPMVEETNIDEGSGGNAMAAGGIVLAGDGAPAMASGGGVSSGASGCSLQSDLGAAFSTSGAALIWVFLLLPLPLLIPLRNRKK